MTNAVDKLRVLLVEIDPWRKVLAKPSIIPQEQLERLDDILSFQITNDVENAASEVIATNWREYALMVHGEGVLAAYYASLPENYPDKRPAELGTAQLLENAKIAALYAFKGDGEEFNDTLLDTIKGRPRHDPTRKAVERQLEIKREVYDRFRGILWRHDLPVCDPVCNNECQEKCDQQSSNDWTWLFPSSQETCKRMHATVSNKCPQGLDDGHYEAIKSGFDAVVANYSVRVVQDIRNRLKGSLDWKEIEPKLRKMVADGHSLDWAEIGPKLHQMVEGSLDWKEIDQNLRHMADKCLWDLAKIEPILREMVDTLDTLILDNEETLRQHRKEKDEVRAKASQARLSLYLTQRSHAKIVYGVLSEEGTLEEANWIIKQHEMATGMKWQYQWMDDVSRLGNMESESNPSIDSILDHIEGKTHGTDAQKPSDVYFDHLTGQDHAATEKERVSAATTFGGLISATVATLRPIVESALEHSSNFGTLRVVIGEVLAHVHDTIMCERAMTLILTSKNNPLIDALLGRHWLDERLILMRLRKSVRAEVASRRATKKMSWWVPALLLMAFTSSWVFPKLRKAGAVNTVVSRPRTDEEVVGEFCPNDSYFPFKDPTKDAAKNAMVVLKRGAGDNSADWTAADMQDNAVLGACRDSFLGGKKRADGLKFLRSLPSNRP
jgi:hypothetical protein